MLAGKGFGKRQAGKQIRASLFITGNLLILAALAKNTLAFALSGAIDHVPACQLAFPCRL
jgi:hypothetical protein